jgi:GrpB-like predicted nucleotidyltransferase (UPF0157 family)
MLLMPHMGSIKILTFGGLMAEPMQIVEYNPNWISMFEMIRAFVTPVLADIIVAIEHVGSTSLTGLSAKPIVDVDVVVSSQKQVLIAIQRLEPLDTSIKVTWGFQGVQPLLNQMVYPYIICMFAKQTMRN